MRTIILFVACVFFVTTFVNAQISKGSVFLGGDFSASRQKVKPDLGSSYSTKWISVSPLAGKFIKDNLVLGANLGFIYSNSGNDLDINTKIRGYQAGLFLRKYKNLGTSGFYIFGQVGLNGNHYTYNSKQGTGAYNDKLKQVGISLVGYPGLSYAVNKKFHLETGFNQFINLSFTHEKKEFINAPGNGYTHDTFAVSTSLNNATSALYLGFRVILGK